MSRFIYPFKVYRIMLDSFRLLHVSCSSASHLTSILSFDCIVICLSAREKVFIFIFFTTKFRKKKDGSASNNTLFVKHCAKKWVDKKYRFYVKTKRFDCSACVQESRFELKLYRYNIHLSIKRLIWFTCQI